MTKISLGEIFRKVIMYPEAKGMQRTFKTNRSNEGGLFVPENLMGNFV